MSAAICRRARAIQDQHRTVDILEAIASGAGFCGARMPYRPRDVAVPFHLCETAEGSGRARFQVRSPCCRFD